MSLAHRVALSGLLTMCLAGSAAAQSQTWTFDETTTGGDIAWTSPTSVAATAAVYNCDFEITAVDVGIEFLGIPFGTVDALAQIPPEQQMGSAPVDGPAPLSILAESLIFPEPPEAPAIAADLAIGMDAGGFGFFNVQNVTLGTMMVDLGSPFGTVAVDIVSIRVAGSLTINATWFDLGNALFGSNGTPDLAGVGALKGGDQVDLNLTNGLQSANAFFVVGVNVLGLPFEGGVLIPDPNPPGFFVVVPTDSLGALTVGGVWPTGIPGGLSLYYQVWIPDAGGPAGHAASNALRSVTP